VSEPHTTEAIPQNFEKKRQKTGNLSQKISYTLYNKELMKKKSGNDPYMFNHSSYEPGSADSLQSLLCFSRHSAGCLFESFNRKNKHFTLMFDSFDHKIEETKLQIKYLP
jgi:hypothetical protein